MIYCRNNIDDDIVGMFKENGHISRESQPVNLDVVFDKTNRLHTSKTYSAGLNVPVAITLRVYGYDNVWELDEIVDPRESPIDFVWAPSVVQEAKKIKSTSLTDEKSQSVKTDHVRTGACDFDGFIDVAKQWSKEREAKLLTADQFARLSSEPDTLILDARSELSYELMHVKGSINLPYTMFGIRNLTKRIPDRSTKILIYCRNNLRTSAVQEAVEGAGLDEDEEVLLATTIKRPYAGLNIPVAIALRIYGYDNVWELDEVVDPNDSPINFVGKMR